MLIRDSDRPLGWVFNASELVTDRDIGSVVSVVGVSSCTSSDVDDGAMEMLSVIQLREECSIFDTASSEGFEEMAECVSDRASKSIIGVWNCVGSEVFRESEVDVSAGCGGSIVVVPGFADSGAFTTDLDIARSSPVTLSTSMPSTTCSESVDINAITVKETCSWFW